MYLLLILLMPLLSSMVQVAPMNLSQNRKNQLSQVLIGFALLLGLVSIYVLQVDSSWVLPLGLFDSLTMNLVLYFDALTWIMLCLVLFIACIIHRFSATYMYSDSASHRFMSLLSLLTSTVLLLVMSGSLLTALIAWQLKGFTLYFMLNFNHHSQKANLYAKQKLTINRFGDFCFLIAVILSVQYYGSSEYTILFQQADNVSQVILGLIFIAIMTKSAQFPFHTWLINSMEAPTPVSALMHAGIVNAGGFLLARLSPLYIESSPILLAIFLVGLFTALYGNFMMKHQSDVKREMAYSTVAQMGFMILQCGIGAFVSAVFHLFAHGILKATQFLSVGSTLNFNKVEPNTKTVSSGHKPDYSLLSGVLSTSIVILTMIFFYVTNMANAIHPIIMLFIGITLFQLINDCYQRSGPFKVNIIKLCLIVMCYVSYLCFYLSFKTILSLSVINDPVLLNIEFGFIGLLLPILLFQKPLWRHIKKQYPNLVLRLYRLAIFRSSYQFSIVGLSKKSLSKIKSHYHLVQSEKWPLLVSLMSVICLIYSSKYAMLTGGLSLLAFAYLGFMLLIYGLIISIKRRHYLWASLFHSVFCLSVILSNHALLSDTALAVVAQMNLLFIGIVLILSFVIQLGTHLIRPHIVRHVLDAKKPFLLLFVVAFLMSGLPLKLLGMLLLIVTHTHSMLTTLIFGAGIFMITLSVFNLIEHVLLQKNTQKNYAFRVFGLLPLFIVLGTLGNGLFL